MKLADLELVSIEMNGLRALFSKLSVMAEVKYRECSNLSVAAKK